LGKAETLIGELIKLRSLYFGAKAAQVAVSHVVCEQDQDIRLFLGGGCLF
jgi:hypothetical protein